MMIRPLCSRSSLKGLTVENVLMSAAMCKIIDNCGVRVRTERTKRVREIFELIVVYGSEQLNVTKLSK